MTIDGNDVRKITRDSLLDRFSIVTQQTFLFNRSIADNIRYGRRDATQAEVEQAARAANIHDFIVSQPEGYNALCGEFGAKLSGGQRQRIAIARALLKNADILILDEAMAGLDAESESLVREALANLMRGRTTLGHHARPAHHPATPTASSSSKTAASSARARTTNSWRRAASTARSTPSNSAARRRKANEWPGFGWRRAGR